jgi:hypothetical protein
MKKRNKKFFQILLCLFVSVLSTTKTLAEDDGGPEMPPAPIDDYIYPMMLVSILIGFCFLYFRNKKRALNNTNL